MKFTKTATMQAWLSEDIETSKHEQASRRAVPRRRYRRHQFEAKEGSPPRLPPHLASLAVHRLISSGSSPATAGWPGHCGHAIHPS